MSEKMQKRDTSLWGPRWSVRCVSRRRRERPVPTLSAPIRRNSGAQWVRRREPGFTPQNLQGGTPGSECMFRHPQVPWGAPRRYLTVLVMEQTESTAQGCRQTSKSRSDVRFRATSQGTAQHCAKKEHSLFTDSNSHRQPSKQGPQGAREIPLPTQYQPREQPKIAMLLPGHFLP